MPRYPEKIELDSDGRRVTYVLRAGSDAPVYETGDGGEATATGRVWVRFADGTDARSRAAELSAAGYEIEGIPAYAPSAAHVRAAGVAAALEGLDRLRGIDGVASVEPEMLRERSFRG